MPNSQGVANLYLFCLDAHPSPCFRLGWWLLAGWLLLLPCPGSVNGSTSSRSLEVGNVILKTYVVGLNKMRVLCSVLVFHSPPSVPWGSVSRCWCCCCRVVWTIPPLFSHHRNRDTSRTRTCSVSKHGQGKSGRRRRKSRSVKVRARTKKMKSFIILKTCLLVGMAR